MATIKAFKGVRPKAGLEKKIASLPYDVVNSKEARKIAEGNEYSFFHVTKPEIGLDENINLYDPIVYKTAKNNFLKFLEKEWLIEDKEDRLYIYKQKMGDHEQYGLMACASCDDYDNDIIKKHEFTRKDKEDDRTQHVQIVGANAGPVFLTYKARKSIDEIIFMYTTENKPVYDFMADDGISHVLWIIKEKSIIDTLIKEFEKIDFLYVADGHHRAASGSRTRKLRKDQNPKHTGSEEYNYFLTSIFPDNQLQILPYNRAVKDLCGLTNLMFIEKVKENFDVQETSLKAPSKRQNFCMYLENKWYLLKSKEIISNQSYLDSLDVSILQNNILSPILKIEDPRTDNRINFIGGIRGTSELEKIVDSGKFKVAFSMFPTQVADIMNIASHGQVMPPKSTWFEPKLRSGLVVHLLD